MRSISSSVAPRYYAKTLAEADGFLVAAPDAPTVVQGPVTGSLKATSAPLYGASSYNWSAALQSAPETDVKTAQTTGARAEFTGLTPGQIYVVSLNAVGTAGVSDRSDAGTLMVV